MDYSEDVLAKNVDQEFVGKKGYTHFHRTRKGGDAAPNRVVDVNKLPAWTKKKVTMFNFFARAGKSVVPLPVARANKKPAHKAGLSRPPVTRTKWGRPKKDTGTVSAKVVKLKATCKSKREGELAVPPKQRRKQSGTLRQKVTNLTKTFLEQSGGDSRVAADILSNFEAQRVVQPFVFRYPQTETERVGRGVSKANNIIRRLDITD